LPILFGWFEAEKKPQGFHSQGAFLLTAPSVNNRSVVDIFMIMLPTAIQAITVPLTSMCQKTIAMTQRKIPIGKRFLSGFQMTQ